MMRILHYIPTIDRADGGTSTYMAVLANALGCMVELHVVTSKTANPVELKNCHVHFVPDFKLTGWQWHKIVSRLIDELHPDVIHINCCWMPACAAMQRLADRHGIPTVLTPHGMLEPWIISRHYLTRKWPALLLYQRKAIARAGFIHATAEMEANNILTLGYNRNVRVAGLGIDVEAVPQRSSWLQQRRLLFLSRIHEKKGVEDLIAAASRLKKQLDGYEIVIAGEGEDGYIAQLKAKISGAGLQGVVKMLGGVYGERKWQLLHESDFMVLPTYSENFGYVIAEALATATPVVTTTGTPWRELNTEGCGACIETGVEPLVKALGAFMVLTDAGREQMGLRGRKLVERKYSSKAMAEAIAMMYRDLSDK